MRGDRPLTALLVEIPEAEPVVGALRSSLDPSAALGVPAHVTVLFPFLDADDVHDGVLERVAAVVGDGHVVWLAPDDDAPFRGLTDRIWREFPAPPPFEGAFDDVVPHLTVGQDQPLEVLRAAETTAQERLPVAGTATEVLLLAQQMAGGRWVRRERFPLGDPS